MAGLKDPLKIGEKLCEKYYYLLTRIIHEPRFEEDSLTRELKIGIFIVVAISILVTFIFVIGDFGVLFKKGYLLYASFDSAAGLEKRTIVRMAGVKVGYIKDIRLKGSKAEILMNIDSGVAVPRGSKATLATLGLLGERHIEIIPEKATEYYEQGETIEGIPYVSFDQMGTFMALLSTELKEMGKILNGIVGEEESRANFRNTLSNLSSFTSDLNEFFGANKEELQRGLQSSSQAFQKFEQRIDGVSQNLDELIALLKDMVEENRESIKLNLESIKDLIIKTEESFNLLNESLRKINRGEGTLGKLINQKELYEKAEAAVSELERIIHPVSNIKAVGGLTTEYYGRSKRLKNYFSLALWTEKKKYLLTQIIHDPWLDKFVYSAQGGVRWGAFSLRAGIMESEIGAGLDYYVAGDRLKFSLESFDFNRHPRPHLRIWTRYAASRYFYLLFGIDDFTLAPKREIYFGLEFGF
jgi:ABC-type transporter Mla subunit MlaD